ncbi:chromatin segregase YTA7 SCDLUD_004857 [Saccharomycodes ludwigii]|uniref:chromatin segregase YTA7 n=1 Tax=Saccharomycodes ludwigii TaxID=36035 RepID=UPI001E87440E|nr:hypothetical protein SCDLUD_004857 [Saccharomycodes ludwigii]KAH3899414.1 hypothetical protein SCDLUD_004857 [Saccharomycodes ludwigii]
MSVNTQEEIHHTTRRRKVNYAEIEHTYDFMDTDDEENYQPPKIDPNNNNIVTEDNIPIGRNNTGRKRRRQRRKIENGDYDDDESFHEDTIDDHRDDDEEENYTAQEFIHYDDDDDFIVGQRRKGRRKGGRRGRRPGTKKELDFIEKDDDYSDEDFAYNGTSGSKSKKRLQPGTNNDNVSPRKRGKSVRQTGDDEETVDLSLEQELKELKEDAPMDIPQRSLRERKKEVNYAIPPAIDLIPSPEDNSLHASKPQYSQTTSFSNSPRKGPGRRGGGATTSFGPIRRLFPTGGPFGGNDVTSIFGKNTNIYNTNNNNNNNNGTSSNINNTTLLLDSDSSDDEILPFGENSTKKSSTKKRSKSKKPEIADTDPLGVDMNIDFNDVGGLDNYIDQLKEMVALPLLYPELYANFNITPPRGVLFHGPPGTGKTLMARALAASCSKTSGKKITFFMRKGADILSKWVGEAERQLRLLFEEAKNNQPAIIFFDEIDGLAPVRSSKQEQIHASIVSTLLALMDGMDNRGQVIVIGATNRPDAVDPALRRPGRFDREFYFPLPNEDARAKIIEIHTKKWTPLLPKKMILKIAQLTRGYGGADLRALCTEAALNSIQRRYPQIYQSSAKLKLDPSKVSVTAKDFILALEKIVPSSARSANNFISQPLPKNIECLLNLQLESLKWELDRIIPTDSVTKKASKSMIKYYTEYEDDIDGDTDAATLDGGFGKQEFLKEINMARVAKPRFLLSGPRGNGQQYIGSALLNYLEGFNVQTLDLGSIMSEATKTMEACVVQTFNEAKRRQPSVIYIPNFETWIKSVLPTVVYTLSSLLRTLKADDKILLMAICDGDLPVNNAFINEFDFETVFELVKPSEKQRGEYFKELAQLFNTKPSKFELSKKRTKPLEKLTEVEPTEYENDSDYDSDGNPLSARDKLKKELKKYQYDDMKLKNTLKIKLSGLMDLFKNRYKRFRKPIIDDAYLVHLFEPIPETDPAISWQPAYIKNGDKILEVATGRNYYNMDLDIIEERLWNGFYSEPKQFLKDIELIYHDSNTSEDRERIIKASEMFANAQVGIEDISVPEFIRQCKETRKREILRQKLYQEEELEKQKVEKQKLEKEKKNDTEKEEKHALVEEGKQQSEEHHTAEADPQNTKLVSVGSGSQLQAQLLVKKSSDFISKATSVSYLLNDDDTSKEDLVKEDLVKEDLVKQGKNVEHLEVTNPTKANTTDTSQVTEDKIIPENDNAFKDKKETKNGNNTDVVNTSLDKLKTEDPEPAFIIDELRLNECINKLLLSTDGFTVDQLQKKYANIISECWKYRFNWDRTEALDKFSQII